VRLETDGSGKRYVEVSTWPGEQARITFVPAEDAGYGEDSIRVQIREPNGRLGMCMGDSAAGVVALLGPRP
jgi:hypothetical protein